MTRLARVVVPDYPHHVTQRGNRRQTTFFCDDDYRAYLSLMAAACRACGTEVWAYCLMPNHVHAVMVPRDPDGLRCAIADAHRRYALRINAREGWQGHLWQDRFHSCVLDEPHLLAAVRYVENNPLRAGLCAAAHEWPWSSARAHLAGQDDALARVAPMLALVANWSAYLAEPNRDGLADALHSHGRTGRPLAADDFVEALESRLARPLRPGKRGPKPRSPPTDTLDLLDSAGENRH